MRRKLTPELWQRLEPILDGAMDLPAERRRSYIDKACADDPDLIEAIEVLLAADTDATRAFLDSLGDAIPGILSKLVPLTSIDGDVGDSPAVMDSLPQEIDGYRILAVLGEGGMGVVYLAEQIEPLQRRVAVKVIKLGMDTEEVVARFEAERQALAMMDHPSIARVFDAGVTADGRPYFVMEHVDGVPITDYCDRHESKMPARLDLFARVCDAIQHAHQKGVIHRDIKPSNVLVAEQDGHPVPKVIDFGIAKAVEQSLTERTLFTEQGQLIGTPAYMSPEQAEGSGTDVDTRTDVYSLGVLLYEMLTGTPPFDPRELRRAGFAAIQQMIRETDPPKPSARLRAFPGDTTSDVASRRGTDQRTLVRQVEGELDWVVMKAMEKKRTRRYDTVSGLGLDVRRILAHEPVLARPPSRAYRLRKFVRRHRAGVAAAAVALVAVAVGIGGLTWGLLEARRERDEAERQSAIATAINEFVNTDLLAGVNPEQGGGRQITMLEVVENASERIGDRFEDQPAVEGALRYTLGQSFYALGEYNAAEEHLQRATELYEASYGPWGVETLSAKSSIGAVYAYQGRFEEAGEIFRDAYEGSLATLGPDDMDTMRQLNNLVFIWDQLGRYDETLPMHLDLLERRTRVLGEKHPDTLVSMNNTAHVYLRLDRVAEAEPLWRRRVELCPEVLGPTHPETLNAYNSLGMAYVIQERFEDAEQVLQTALEQARPNLGDEHPITLGLMHTLAKAYLNQHRLDDAEPWIVTTVESKRRVHGSSHPSTLASLNVLAELRCRQERGGEAIDLYEECVAAFRALAPQGDVRLGDTLSNYGRCLTSLSRFARAESVLLEADPLLLRLTDESEERYQTLVVRLVELNEAWGRPDEAARWRAKRR